MKRKSIILSVAFLFVLSFFVSSNIINAKSDFPIGTKLDNFTMPAPDGTKHSYTDLKGEKGTLIVFLSIKCPVVKLYDERINDIAKEYQAKGIKFIGIYSNYTEPAEDVKSYTKDKYNFPVLMDENNEFANKLGATKTPEVYYFGADDKLAYHGAIDNDKYAKNIEKQYLKTAFDEKLSNKEINEKETAAFGCSIKTIEKADMK